MKTPLAFVALSLAGFATFAPAAPAPLPRADRSSIAEIVFDTRTAERARLAVIHLRSAALLEHLAQSPVVARRLSAVPGKDRRDWLARRITAEVSPTGRQVT